MVNSLRQCPYSVIKLAFLTVQNLKTKFLVLKLLLLGPEIALKLVNRILLLLLNVMIVCNLLVKALDVSPQGVVVQAELLQIR